MIKNVLLDPNTETLFLAPQLPGVQQQSAGPRSGQQPLQTVLRSGPALSEHRTVSPGGSLQPVGVLELLQLPQQGKDGPRCVSEPPQISDQNSAAGNQALCLLVPQVVTLYLSCLPQSQHALVLERLRYAMPNNTELGLRYSPHPHIRVNPAVMLSSQFR